MRKLAITTAAALAAGWAFGASPVKLWEKLIGARTHFAPMGGATVADVDGDGKEEVLAASTDGKCYVWRHDGGAYPGFPKEVHRSGIFFQHSPSVGDIDGDGDAEVVVGARGMASDGALYAWHHDGKAVSGFPKDGIYIQGTPTLADLDGDGALEVIAAERRWPVGTLHVFDGAGRELPGWPKDLPSYPSAEPSVGDLDGDKKLEILIGTKTSDGKSPLLYAWHRDGTPVNGFPFKVNKIDVGFAAPTLADFNNDGRLEIAIGTSYGGSSAEPEFYVIRADGTTAPGWPKPIKYGVRGEASAADIDGDGYLEIIGREYEVTSALGRRTFVWNYDGSSVPGFPVKPGGGSAATVADIDNDGRFEILADTRDSLVVAFNHDGSPTEGFPLRVSLWTWFCSPTVWDIDDDGALELVVLTGAGWSNGAAVEVFRLGGDAASPVWPMGLHDQWYTGCYDTDLRIGIVLDYFCARAEGEGVLIRWATAGEWNHAGFNLYRASADAAKSKLNAELIKGKSPYRYLDTGIESGEEYKYWLEAVELTGSKETYGPVYGTAGGVPKASFALAQNAPNPARAATTIAFSVPAACDSTLAVYDIAGRKVATPFTGQAKAGENELVVDVSTLAPGVYTYRLEAGDWAGAKKMVVVR